MEINLSNIEKKALQKKAYSLKPVVMIGQKGLTDTVLVEVDMVYMALRVVWVVHRNDQHGCSDLLEPLTFV